MFHFSITALADCNVAQVAMAKTLKSSPSCKVTDSSKPTANLLVITYLQRPGDRRYCNNTFDTEHTQMFVFSRLVALKYPSGYRSETLSGV